MYDTLRLSIFYDFLSKVKNFFFQYFRLKSIFLFLLILSFFFNFFGKNVIGEGACHLADANCDGVVDNDDFDVFYDNYLKNVSGGAREGDFNNDGFVGGIDYVLWLNNFGWSAPRTTPTLRPSSTPVSIPSTTITPMPTSTPLAKGPVIGIWTSPKELASKPMSGPAWEAVKSAADSLSDSPNPDLDNQDDPTNVAVMAAAIVYARTNNEIYRQKVVNALRKVEQFEPKGRSLAWARETGAYAIAADLVGYRTLQFENKMRMMVEGYICSQTGKTMLGMFKVRPNNWGTQAFGSLTAVYRYLKDDARLREVRDYFVAGVKGESTQLEYGSLSWQFDEGNPRIINPKGAVKDCGGKVNIDGILPDDMRRGGGCSVDPSYTGYPWEAMQGITMAARILERAGMSIWEEDNNAICRAASALQDARFGDEWKAKGDDEWQLSFLSRACQRPDWLSGYGNGIWRSGKNVGWAYVLE